MNFFPSATVPMALSNMVGIAIKVTDIDQRLMHVGLLYIKSTGVLTMLHLANHHVLINESARDGKYFWANCEWLDMDEETADFLAAYIESVSENSDVAYGLAPFDDAFGPSGDYQQDASLRGLTCATFVAGVFQGAGFSVVDVGTWEKREGDEQWKKSVVEMLTGFDPAHARHVEGQQLLFRLKPNEVAVAAAGVVVPRTYEETLGDADLLSTLMFR